MDRRGTAVAAGAGATMLIAAWVSAAGPVGIFARQDFNGSESKAPGQDFDPLPPPRQGGSGARTAETHQASPFLVQLVDWGLKALVVVIVLFVLVVVVRSLWSRGRGPTTAGSEEVTAGVLPEALLARARESEELLSRGTPSNAIIAAWVSLEDAVRSAGVRNDDTRTSSELVAVVLRNLSVDPAALDRMAALYREARFSHHPITEEMRSEARTALRQVQADLARAAATSAPASRAAGAR